MSYMHPFIAHKVVVQHQRDQAAMAAPRMWERAAARCTALRPCRTVRWRICWSGMVSGEPRSRTWMIVISVRRGGSQGGEPAVARTTRLRARWLRP